MYYVLQGVTYRKEVIESSKSPTVYGISHTRRVSKRQRISIEISN